MEQELKLLKAGAASFGTELSDAALKNFETFTKELLSVNETMNLTAITEVNEVVTKHYLDSLFLLKTGLFVKNARVIDVGCGAGFPCIPLKIARPNLFLVCEDALGKRVDFLRRTGEKMGLSGIEYLHLRAEEGAKKENMRESFDIAVSRAVASLPVLCEFCLPYVKTGGFFIAMKGPSPKDEVEGAKGSIEILGGKLKEVMAAPIYSTDIVHSLVIIEKVRPCEKKYPRPFSKITKYPLA